jgi:hypothetical protein
VRIAIQNPSGTLAFGGHLLSPTTSEAKWKGNRLLLQHQISRMLNIVWFPTKEIIATLASV